MVPLLEQTTLPGPMFEAGPGWGKRLKQWWQRNFRRKILPTVAMLFFLAGIASIYSPPVPSEKPTTEEVEKVAVYVQKGEGMVMVTRRALFQYLSQAPNIVLRPEEKLYIENFFSKKIASSLTVGQEVVFLFSDFSKAVSEAQQMTEGQRQKLRLYLK